MKKGSRRIARNSNSIYAARGLNNRRISHSTVTREHKRRGPKMFRQRKKPKNSELNIEDRVWFCDCCPCMQPASHSLALFHPLVETAQDPARAHDGVASIVRLAAPFGSGMSMSVRLDSHVVGMVHYRQISTETMPDSPLVLVLRPFKMRNAAHLGPHCMLSLTLEECSPESAFCTVLCFNL